MRLDAAPVPVAGADVNVGLVLVEDEPPVEVLLEDEPPVEWLVPLPDDGACEADAVLVGVDDLVGGAVVVVFVVCGVEVLRLAFLVIEPVDSEVGLGHGVGESVGLAEVLVPAGGSAETGFVVSSLGVGLGLVLVVLGLELSLVLGLPPPDVEVGGVTVGLGGAVDELAEGAGLDLVGAGVEVLCFAAGVDVEADAADVVGLHDVPTATGVVGAPVPASLPAPLLVVGLDGPAFGELVEEVLGEATPASWASESRSGGTAASRTPTANTQMPNAKAGRSIISRQSLGRCAARCECRGAARWGAVDVRPRQRPTRPARNAAIARRKVAK